MKRRYGLDENQYQRMLEAQGGGCAICLVGKAEQVDHDHETGKVRGILCFNCNGGLGQFKDDIQRLTWAINYLKGDFCLTEPVEPVDCQPST